jgi:hypothetical protein
MKSSGLLHGVPTHLSQNSLRLLNSDTTSRDYSVVDHEEILQFITVVVNVSGINTKKLGVLRHEHHLAGFYFLLCSALKFLNMRLSI